jgi:hypothetical protein
MVIILQSILVLCVNSVVDIRVLPTLTSEDISDLSEAARDEQALLVKERQRMLAVAFRDYMTTGQSFQDPNPYRRAFFKEIIDLAAEVSFHSSSPSVKMTCLQVHERQSASTEVKKW